MASPAQPPAHRTTLSSEMPVLARNIRHLCGFHPSISSVCRALDINRQQFNKYLSGAATPSVFILGRIARYFGLRAEDLFLPHNEFCRKFSGPLRGPVIDASSADGALRQRLLDELLSLTSSNANIMQRYMGYYFRYYYDFDSSGRVVRSLFRIAKQDNIFVTRHFERVQHRSNTAGQLTTFKYDGVLVALSGCLFNLEFERLMRSCVSYAAFPCIPRPGQRFVAGIQSSFSSYTGRPAATRVALERIARPANLRELISRCGTFAVETGAIDRDVLPLIGNQLLRDSDLFGPITL